MIMGGDAWMREEDAERASDIMCVSLAQFVDAVSGRGSAPGSSRRNCRRWNQIRLTWVQHRSPQREFDPAAIQFFAETLLETPIPALGSGMGELPRFRAELGPFIGLVSAAAVRNARRRFRRGSDRRRRNCWAEGCVAGRIWNRGGHERVGGWAGLSRRGGPGGRRMY